MLPLPAEQLAHWRGAIEKSRAARKTVSVWAEANLKAYAPGPTDSPEAYGQKLNTNRDFTLVERKKADLFYQRPDVTAMPSPLFDGQEPLLDTHTKILNEKLGLDGVNAKALVHQVLFDVLCPSGTGWTKMGYESVTVETKTVDPMTGQPMSVPVPVYEDCFWEWFSAKQKGWVPETFEGSSPSEDLHFTHGQSQGGGDAVVHGMELFYKSALFRKDIVHPLHQTQLILIEGVETPAEHRDSPYQTLDAQGRLTPDSLIGFPIHPLTIRTLTDSADVPSDCTISRPLVNELNKFRGQMIEFREAAILRWMYNTDVLPPDAL